MTQPVLVIKDYKFSSHPPLDSESKKDERKEKNYLSQSTTGMIDSILVSKKLWGKYYFMHVHRIFLCWPCFQLKHVNQEILLWFDIKYKYLISTVRAHFKFRNRIPRNMYESPPFSSSTLALLNIGIYLYEALIFFGDCIC